MFYVRNDMTPFLFILYLMSQRIHYRCYQLHIIPGCILIFSHEDLYFYFIITGTTNTHHLITYVTPNSRHVFVSSHVVGWTTWQLISTPFNQAFNFRINRCLCDGPCLSEIVYYLNKELPCIWDESKRPPGPWFNKRCHLISIGNPILWR